MTGDPAAQEGLGSGGELLKVRQGQFRVLQGEVAHVRAWLVDERAQHVTREVGVVDEQWSDVQYVTVSADQSFQNLRWCVRPTGGSTANYEFRVAVQPTPCLFRQVVTGGQYAPEGCVLAVQVGHLLIERRLAQPVRFGEVPAQSHFRLDTSVRAFGFYERIQSLPGFGVHMPTLRNRDPHERVVDAQELGNHLCR
nr:hypothetical protein StreXyl84_63530 [Streptomyces sp. Xyl84]